MQKSKAHLRQGFGEQAKSGATKDQLPKTKDLLKH
jgi:hypothetical protein